MLNCGAIPSLSDVTESPEYDGELLEPPISSVFGCEPDELYDMLDCLEKALTQGNARDVSHRIKDMTIGLIRQLGHDVPVNFDDGHDSEEVVDDIATEALNVLVV